MDYVFREMRRRKQRLSDDAARDILKNGFWGVLSVEGENGFPYGVPMNYAYWDGAIYMHCTSDESHKLDGIRKNDRVCFTVVAQHVLEEKELACHYTSAIVFGIAEIIHSPEEKAIAMECFMKGLSPSMGMDWAKKCDPRAESLSVIKIKPLHVTAKSGH